VKNIEAIIQQVLETPFWLSTIKTRECYQRYEDDSPLGFLSITFGDDGDGHMLVIHEQDPNEPRFSMRFRMPMTGGGQSPRVRNALLILAEAIRLDNLEQPQNRRRAK